MSPDPARLSSTPRSRFARTTPARLLQVALLGAVLCYGVALRAWDLGSAPLWTDEAESSINALSILQHGVPMGDYLGVPIFENVLIEPWPDHPEFEFRDTSYSAAGLAVYHGWLPLYAIAASFALHGIDPDVDPSHLIPRHELDELYRRTRAARLPSIVFGFIFLVGIFLAGREIYGRDAAWAAVAAACVSTTTVTLARQARYYSLTLALVAFAALALARMHTRGRRRDFLIGGGVFVLLFHTNVLAFVSAWGAFALLLPGLLRRRGALRDLLLFCGIVTAGVLPWILFTGYAQAATAHPAARSLLEWADLFHYVAQRALFASLAVFTLVCYVAARFVGNRLPERVAAPLGQARWGFVFLSGWALVAFLAFNLLVPAASYFHSRLTLVILVPALMFGAGLAGVVGRILAPRAAGVVAVGLYTLLLVSSDKATVWWPHMMPGQPAIFQVIDHLRDVEAEPGTLFYADTGASLILRFYTGMPFKSVLPVRASFLATTDRPLLVVEAPRHEALREPDVQAALARRGLAPGAVEAVQVMRWFNEEAVRRELVTRGARVRSPEPRGLPVDDAGFGELMAELDRKSEAAVARVIEVGGNPLFRGFRVTNYTELWQLFFYRFTDPGARMGENLNYVARVPGSDGYVMSRGWVVIRAAATRLIPRP